MRTLAEGQVPSSLMTWSAWETSLDLLTADTMVLDSLTAAHMLMILVLGADNVSTNDCVSVCVCVCVCVVTRMIVLLRLPHK